MAAKTIKVTQIGSPIGRPEKQRATLIGLGLNKMGKTVELQDTPAIRGMIRKFLTWSRLRSREIAGGWSGRPISKRSA